MQHRTPFAAALTLLVFAGTPMAQTAPAAAASAAASIPTNTPTSTAASVCAEVEVRNVRPQQGVVMVAAYLGAADFGKKAVSSLRLSAGDAVMRFQLCGLSGDTVALTLFQDLDSDGKMGRNLLGIPSEPWGSSGSPGPFGPNWDSAKVALDGKVIAVNLSN